MNFLNSSHFWSTLWAVLVITVLTFIVIFDFTAVYEGKKDHVGDSFTLTHWLVTKIGLSILGAGIGYLVAHFLIVHRNG
jgi:hypothetical protein